MSVTMRPRFGILAALAAVVSLPFALPFGLAAQEAEPGVFGEVLDVRVVNLEVVVTDRSRARVSGLGREDFRLLVDGEEVPIDFFTEVVAGTAVTAEGTAPVPALVAGERVGTSYLVFIDDFFALPNDRNRVLSALREQLGHLGPEDRMAVVAYDGKAVEMISSWSQSRPALERALEQAARRPALGLHRVAERRSLDRDRRDGVGLAARQQVGAFSQLTVEERYHAERLEGQVRRSIDAAAASLRSFANPPGRKVMLLLSGGWPHRPAQFVANDPDRVFLEDSTLRGGDPLFRPLTEAANLLGYTLYPVDVPGSSYEHTVSAEDMAPREPGGIDLRESELRYSLEHIARRTGGRALLSSQRLTALEDVSLDTRSYYWLGFTPKRMRDDKRYDIRVEVRKPGLRVRHRESFQDYSRQAEVSLAVESALQFGNPPSARPLEVRQGAVIRASRGTMEVPLEIRIPADAVTFIPAPGGLAAQLEVRIGVRDDQGQTVPVPVVPVQVQLAEQPDAETVLRYETTLRLRRSGHDVVVALYDPLSGAMFSTTLRIEP